MFIYTFDNLESSGRLGTPTAEIRYDNSAQKPAKLMCTFFTVIN